MKLHTTGKYGSVPGQNSRSSVIGLIDSFASLKNSQIKQATSLKLYDRYDYCSSIALDDSVKAKNSFRMRTVSRLIKTTSAIPHQKRKREMKSKKTKGKNAIVSKLTLFAFIT